MLCELCLISMLSAYQAIQTDIDQTKLFLTQGYQEENPALGSRPSKDMLDLIAISLKLALLGANISHLTSTHKLSLNESVRFTEELVTQNNGSYKVWPPAIGLVYSWEY